MNNYQKIIKSVKDGEAIHLIMLNSSKEKIINSSIEELSEIINNNMDNKPCDYYCNNCSQNGVSLSYCKQKIINYLKQ